MKLVFASDIHGSAYYCEKLLQAYAREGADKLFLLGDLLYHGPRNALPRDYAPARVAEMLNANRAHILCVRGNCDSEVDQMVLDFPILADYAVVYFGGRMAYLTHGHVHNSQNLPPMQPGDLLIHGHTHVQAMQVKPDHIYLNPGSVSIPKEGNVNSYMTYADGVFCIKTMAGEEISRLSILD